MVFGHICGGIWCLSDRTSEYLREFSKIIIVIFVYYFVNYEPKHSIMNH